MTQQNLNFGTTAANDGEDLFSAFTKIQANFVELYGSAGAVSHAITDVASAATCDIGAAATDRIRITGSVTITSFGTSANKLRFVHFDAALTLTYNATTLILPDAANKAVEAGDAAIFSSDASGNWRCLNYYSADDDVDSSDVTFTQSGTGAVERTALAKMRESVTVADFNAAADFTYASQTGTNNATAFQNAINAVSAGGVVKIPAGFYRITSNLTVADKNITFEGEGPSGTHLVFDDCNGITLVVDDAANKGARFKGISFVSTANGTRTGIAYTGQATAAPQLYELMFEDCAWFGADRILGLAWGANPSADRCSWLKGCALTTSDRATFFNCLFAANERSFLDAWSYASIAVDVSDATSVVFYNSQFYRWETGVKLGSTSENMEMHGCELVANRYGLICNTTDPSNEHVIDGCHFSSYEIEIDLSLSPTPSGFHSITSNFFLRRGDATSSVYYCIKLKTLDTIIVGNQFAQTDLSLAPVTSGDIAIKLVSGAAYNIIADNTFNRQNICVQIDSGSTNNAVRGNTTRDDVNTILATFLDDSGTATVIGYNGGDRTTRVLQIPGTVAVEFAGAGYKFLSGASRNETLTLTQGSASAVNQVDIVNAATGVAPIVRGQGDDTNIDLELQGKGSGGVVFANTGLRVKDTNGSHLLTIAPGSDLSANRQLTLTTGDAARTITLSGNPTLDDWFDQAVKAASSPTFANPAVTTIELGHASDTTLARSGAGDMTIEGNGVYRAGGTNVPIADGGTNADTARGACANLVTWYVVGQTSVAATRNSVNGAGDATETTIATATIPAGAMGANGRVRITALWSYTNSANSKTLRIRFNGIGGTIYSASTVTTSAVLREQREIGNRNATNSQIGFFSGSGTAFGWGTAASAAITSAVDTTAAVDIVFTTAWAGATAAESITLEGYIVELLSAA